MRSYGVAQAAGGVGSAFGTSWVPRNANVASMAPRTSSASIGPIDASNAMSGRSLTRVFLRSRGSVYACSFSAICVARG